MAWTTPQTWTTNQLVTASDMNTDVRDNTNALKSPPSDQWTGQLTDNITAATWTDIDATNLSLTITTTGGNVMIGYCGYRTSDLDLMNIDVDIDGTRLSGNASGLLYSGGAARINMSFVAVKSGLSAGSHTFKMQFKGDGSNQADIISTHFWVSEIG